MLIFFLLLPTKKTTTTTTTPVRRPHAAPRGRQGDLRHQQAGPKQAAVAVVAGQRACAVRFGQK